MNKYQCQCQFSTWNLTTGLHFALLESPLADSNLMLSPTSFIATMSLAVNRSKVPGPVICDVHVIVLLVTLIIKLFPYGWPLVGSPKAAMEVSPSKISLYHKGTYFPRLWSRTL